MDETHLRLQHARRNAGFETASDAARAFGWNENTYRSHENGERGLRPGVAARYAKAFKTSTSWLLLGTNAEVPGRANTSPDPVIIFGETGISMSKSDGTRYFMDGCTFDTNIKHLHIIVENDEFTPRYNVGDLIFVTELNDGNLMMRDSVFVITKTKEMHLGDIGRFQGKSVIISLDRTVFAHEEIAEYYVVMAVLKRSFYEVRSDPAEDATR